MISVGCYIPCRDDAYNLNKCLNALLNQVLVPKQIVVVNDGSDKKVDALKGEYGFKSVDLPSHEKSYVGSPLMAYVHNQGLDILDQIGSYDYVLVLGADNILPPNYLVDLVTNMRLDGSVIGSGVIKGEKTHQPRGSGRLIKYDFFKGLGLRYPVNYGFETWLLYSALVNGFTYSVYDEVVSESLRRSRYKSRGKAMHVLGYNWKYALGRCFLLFFKSPSTSLKTFLDFFIHNDLKRYDFADWVNEYQHNLFWERIKNFDF